MVAQPAPEDETVTRLLARASRARLRLLPPPEPLDHPADCGRCSIPIFCPGPVDREALRLSLLALRRPHPPAAPPRGPGTFSRWRPEHRDYLRAIFHDRTP